MERRRLVALAALILTVVGVLFYTRTLPAGASGTLQSLQGVPVPEPANLGDFVADKGAAIQLGKTLFWDMQVGSDGQTACATCHFQAGADSRTVNTLNPGQAGGDTRFTLFPGGDGGPNSPLKAGDFPFHRLADPNNAASAVLFDTNDVAGSQGVFRADFGAVGGPQSPNTCEGVPDPIFTLGGADVRQVTGRNAPSVINAAFNYRNFWDGRANNTFNGVNPFGPRDPDAGIWKVVNGQLQRVAVGIPNASLASQAVGPPGSGVEMACNGRTFAAIGKKLTAPGLRPLGQQTVSPTDSRLGSLVTRPVQPGATGLTVSYADLVQRAFRPEYWSATTPIVLTTAEANREHNRNMDVPRRENGRTPADESFTQLQANFSLFFGLAVQLYESTLIADNTPVDQYLAGNPAALTDQQRQGLDVFLTAGCVTCHGGPELTLASVSNVTHEHIERMRVGDGGVAVYDSGMYNIGVRPAGEDPGVGGRDPFGNPLSETGFCQQVFQRQQQGQPPVAGAATICPPPVVTVGARPLEGVAGAPLQPTERAAVTGAFKVPGLRNVELTGPYFHNGGAATLREVVEFYNRGGDFAEQNRDNRDADIMPLGLTEPQKDALVAFLLGLTDERVRCERAPFDHPSLALPNGQSVRVNGRVQEQFLQLPAVGAGGATTGLRPFLNLDPTGKSATATPRGCGAATGTTTVAGRTRFPAPFPPADLAVIWDGVLALALGLALQRRGRLAPRRRADAPALA